MISDPNQFDKETVPCELCDRPIRATVGNKRCDGCWELESRIANNMPLTLKILKQNHNVKVVDVQYTCDCPFVRPASEYAEIKGGDHGSVCDLLRLEKGGRARCNCHYPPRYCPLQKGKILVAIKRG